MHPDPWLACTISSVTQPTGGASSEHWCLSVLALCQKHDEKWLSLVIVNFISEIRKENFLNLKIKEKTRENVTGRERISVTQQHTFRYRTETQNNLKKWYSSTIYYQSGIHE